MLINTGYDFRPGGEPEKRRAAVMFKAFALMGVDCLALSEREFVFGPAYLRELATASPVPLVCANVRDTHADSAYFMPYLRLERAGKKILLTSVVDPKNASQLVRQGLEVDDPVTRLRRLQRDIAHDLFIVVMQGGKELAATWLEQVPGVDVAILGRQRGVQRKGEMLHGAQILYSCNRGQFVSSMDLAPGKGGQSPPVPEHFLLRPKDFAEDAKVAVLVQEFETWLHTYHAERQKDAKDFKKGGLPEILQRLINKNKKVQQQNDHYVGSQRCADCHQQKLVTWKKTRHARAMESLKARKRENDPDCFRCHVTGMVGIGVNQPATAGQPENPFAKLIQHQQGNHHRPNVQCEACHGPGSRHAAAPEKAGKMPFPDEQSCRQCHTRDTDPEFSYQKKIHLVCPKK